MVYPLSVPHPSVLFYIQAISFSWDIGFQGLHFIELSFDFKAAFIAILTCQAAAERALFLGKYHFARFYIHQLVREFNIKQIHLIHC